MDKIDAASQENAGLASVKISYKNVNITSERHDYEIIARLAIQGIRASSGTLQIFWPKFLPLTILNSTNHIESEPVVIEKIERRALIFQTPPLFPDMPVHFIGGESGPRLTYYVDDNLYRTHIRQSKDQEVLRYRLMLDFGNPVEGRLSLGELQKF